MLAGREEKSLLLSVLVLVGKGIRSDFLLKCLEAKNTCQKLMICYHKKDGFQCGPQRINVGAMRRLLPNRHTHTHALPFKGRETLPAMKYCSFAGSVEAPSVRSPGWMCVIDMRQPCGGPQRISPKEKWQSLSQEVAQRGATKPPLLVLSTFSPPQPPPHIYGLNISPLEKRFLQD